jgi:hypothetical protein
LVYGNFFFFFFFFFFFLLLLLSSYFLSLSPPLFLSFVLSFWLEPYGLASPLNDIWTKDGMKMDGWIR